MATQYQPVVTIRFRHAYYSDGILRGATLHPVGPTAKLMMNYRLLAKQAASEFRLLQEFRSENTPAVAIEAPLLLAFGFRSNDPEFQARTDVDFFTGNRQKISIDLRTPGEEATIRLLPVAFGAIDHAVSESSGKLSIIRSDGTIVHEQAFENQTNVILPLPEWPEDVYSLAENGAVKKEFILLHKDSAFDGVVWIPVTAEILNKNIAFSARKIHLQYTVIQKYNTYSQLSLVDEAEMLAFERAERPDLPNAVSFVSAAPVSLSEHHQFRLQIRDGERVVKKHIPFTNKKNISRCLINVHNYCVENYVTI